MTGNDSKALQLNRIYVPTFGFMKDFEGEDWKGEFLDVTAFPFIVEALIARSASQIVLKSLGDIHDKVLLDEVPPKVNKLIKIIEKDRDSLEIALSIFAPIFEEFAIEPQGQGYYLSHRSTSNSTDVDESIDTAYSMFHEFVIGVRHKLQIDIDLDRFKKAVHNLRLNSRNPVGRAHMSFLEGILRSYKPFSIDGLVLVPEASLEQKNRFIEFLEDSSFKELSKVNFGLGLPLRLNQYIVRIKQVIRKIILSERFVPIVSTSLRTIKAATEIPLPDSDLVKMLVPSNYLPPIVSFKEAFEEARAMWTFQYGDKNLAERQEKSLRQVNFLLNKMINETMEKERGKPTWYSFQGDKLTYQGSYDKATIEYSKAIELDPTEIAGYMKRASAYKNQGEWDLAIVDLTKVIELDPTIAVTYNNRGVAYTEKREYDLAIADFTRAIELDPNPAKTYEYRALAYMERGEWDLAIADFTKAIELDPNPVKTYEHRALAYFNKEEWDLAITDCAKAIELNPNTALSYYQRAAALFKKQQYDSSIADFSKTIELDTNHALAYSFRAEAYRYKRQWDLVIADCTKAIELDPNTALAYSTRGKVYLERQQYDMAIHDFTKVIELHPDFGAPYNYRAITYKKKGEKTKALADFKKCLTLTDNPEVIKLCQESIEELTK